MSANAEKEELDLSVIDARLQHLETFLPVKPSYLQGRQSGSQSILSLMQSIQSKLRTVVEERRALSEFLRKYAQIKDVIHEKTNEIDAFALDSGGKKEIVLASESEILSAVEQLKELDLLKNELDSGSLSGKFCPGAFVVNPTSKHMLNFYPLEDIEIQQKKQVMKMKEELNIIIQEYNEQVRTASLLYLSLDSALKTIEENLGI
ncbi:hypothetical protein HDU97_006208 [Phlyctochytrium planicorne]|nr:hypothetical protein HDU97_006208 [Phlyctochytrium planicorne]